MLQDTGQGGASSITVAEDKFCEAISHAVTEYFREDGADTDARFAGPPIAITAFDRLLRGQR